MGVTIVNNLYKFFKGFEVSMDRALNRMAVDIERLSKAQVPIGPTKKMNKNSHGSGQLRASGHHTRVGLLNYRVIYNMVYARFQEFGGDGKRIVRHYTYPGKKKFYLRDAGREIAKRATQYFIQEASGIKI